MKKSQLLIVILIISTTLFGCNFETQSHHPFKSQTLAIAGDSITWGVDPDNEGSQIPDPWVEQVGEKLGFKKTINYGVPSASVMV